MHLLLPYFQSVCRRYDVLETVNSTAPATQASTSVFADEGYPEGKALYMAHPSSSAMELPPSPTCCICVCVPYW